MAFGNNVFSQHHDSTNDRTKRVEEGTLMPEQKERRPTEQEMQEAVEKMVLEELKEIGRKIDEELAGGYGNDISGSTTQNTADPQGKRRNRQQD